MTKEELLKENKQLKECYCNRTDCSGRIKDSKKYDSLVQVQENQQKEFIKYLEAKINFYKINTQGYSMNLVEGILQKHKEIIGVSDDKK